MSVTKQAARQRCAQQSMAAASLAPGGRLQPEERLLACLQAAGRA